MAFGNRKSERVDFERGIPVFIMGIDGTWRRDCLMVDVSQTGARLCVEGSLEGLDLKEFFLLLSSTGLAYRRCQMVRLVGDQIGVEFLKRDKNARNKVSAKQRSADQVVWKPFRISDGSSSSGEASMSDNGSRVGSRRGSGFEWCRRFLDPPYHSVRRVFPSTAGRLAFQAVPSWVISGLSLLPACAVRRPVCIRPSCASWSQRLSRSVSGRRLDCAAPWRVITPPPQGPSLKSGL